MPALLVLLAALALAGCRGPAGVALGPVDHVILVSIDSLRPDHLGAYGYGPRTSPTIDRLAASGVVFERAYSSTSWTLPAHVALLTGLDDATHGVIDDGRKLPATIETLPEALRRAGIHTTGFFSAPYLHPSFGLDHGFERYVNCTGVVKTGNAETPNAFEFLGSYNDVTNPILLARIRAWLRAGPGPGRHFVFIHMWDVHYDYIPPTRYVQRFDPEEMHPVKGPWFGLVRQGASPRDLRHVIARYDGEIRWTDDTLGRLLALFRRAGLLERAAVIVLADHGEEFLEHGRQGHRQTLFEEVLRIPLIVSVPGTRPAARRVRQVVSIVDVAPTVCDLLGVACPADTSGQSLAAFLGRAAQPRVPAPALAELTVAAKKTDQVALVREDGKLIRWNDTGVTKYFDREAMATEQAGTVVDRERLADYGAGLRTALAQLEQRIARATEAGKRLYAGVAPAPPKLDEQTRKHLRALGYID